LALEDAIAEFVMEPKAAFALVACEQFEPLGLGEVLFDFFHEGSAKAFGLMVGMNDQPSNETGSLL
jgi:hypothetical protein